MSPSPTDHHNISAWPFADPSSEYLVDAMQRTILFWDVLRRRSNDYYEYKAMAVPNGQRCRISNVSHTSTLPNRITARCGRIWSWMRKKRSRGEVEDASTALKTVQDMFAVVVR
jgi:hypothetical protein